MRLVVFDIDGTLANTTQVGDECYCQTFQDLYGLDIANMEWDGFKNVTDSGIAKDLIRQHFKREPTRTDISKIEEYFTQLVQKKHATNPERFTEVGGAKAIFETLQNDAAYHIAVATGGFKTTSLFRLNNIGINMEGVPFATSNFSDSRAEITLEAIRQAKEKHPNVHFKNIIYIGDGSWDLITSAGLGIGFMGMDCLKDRKLKKLGAKYVLHNYLSPSRFFAYLEQIVGIN